MNSKITISRADYITDPSARIVIILPGDAGESDLADYSADLNRALRDAFKAAIDAPCCEEYTAETDYNDEDDLDVSSEETIELEGEPIRPALPDCAVEILLDQLRRLDGISCDITAQVDARQMTTTVDAMHSLTQSMCALAEALRV